MYTQKKFSHLLGLEGFSDTMLNNHFTLYGGYVTNANKLIEKLDNENIEKGSIEYNELKRRLGWEVNGIKLHELYFENMQNKTSEEKEGVSMESNEVIKNILTDNYTSVDEWQASLRRNGMIRGIGWVLLVQDNDTKKVFHTWVGEHNVGNIINAKILMVMDCWEHAYMTDYGIKRADYVEAFIKSIDWKVVESRLA